MVEDMHGYPNPNAQIEQSTISVVIPFYNSAETIARATNSVLAQTFPVTEILIIDDASAPQEAQILDALRSQSSIIQVITLNENLGAASARNTGWDRAAGDWIAFLDSDDAWHPRKLELQMQAILTAKSPANMVGCLTEVVSKNRSFMPINVENIPISEITTANLLLKNRFSTSTVVVKSDIPIRFTEGRRYSEDYELWIRISALGPTILRVELPLAYHYKSRYGEAGLSSHVLSMSRGELETFSRLRRSNVITLPAFLGAYIFSITKSARRIFMSKLRIVLDKVRRER